MAKHSSSERNLRLSTDVIVAVVAAIVLVGLGVVWVGVRSNAESDAKAFAERCSEGSMGVTFAALDGTSENVARSLVDSYRESHPKVEDYCVEPQLVNDYTQASAIIATGTREGIQRQLDAHGLRPATDSWAIAGTDPVGVAFAADKEPVHGSWREIPVDRIVFPNPTVHPASFIAAAAVTDNNPDAGAALLRDHPMGTVEAAHNDDRIIATTANSTPEGFTFVAPDDTAVPTFVVPLVAREGVTEQHARAGADFAKTLDRGDEGLADTSVKWASTAEIMSEKFAQVPEASQGSVEVDARDTVLLIDGGDGMSATTPEGHSFFSEALRISDPLIVSTTRSGASLAVWTTDDDILQPQVGFTNDAEAARGVTAGLSPNGTVLSRPEVVNALGYAASHAHDTQRPVSVVIVTAGINPDGMDDDFFRELLGGLSDPQLRVSVVTIAGQPHDGVLDEFASGHGGVVGDARETHELADGLQQAFAVKRP